MGLEETPSSLLSLVKEASIVQYSSPPLIGTQFKRCPLVRESIIAISTICCQEFVSFLEILREEPLYILSNESGSVS